MNAPNPTLITFTRGEGTDPQGRTIHDLWSLPPFWLEHTHDYTKKKALGGQRHIIQYLSQCLSQYLRQYLCHRGWEAGAPDVQNTSNAGGLLRTQWGFGHRIDGLLLEESFSATRPSLPGEGLSLISRGQQTTGRRLEDQRIDDRPVADGRSFLLEPRYRTR